MTDTLSLTIISLLVVTVSLLGITNIVTAQTLEQEEEVKSATVVWKYFENGTGTITYGDGTVRNMTHNYVPPEYVYCNDSMYPVDVMEQMNMTLPSGC
ncbi:MAG TPA: hypothetical protein VJ643_03560 [Nitrososphaera sp.]|nr:hypothetical protein [Nitrososphaera sp.]